MSDLYADGFEDGRRQGALDVARAVGAARHPRVILGFVAGFVVACAVVFVGQSCAASPASTASVLPNEGYAYPVSGIEGK